MTMTITLFIYYYRRVRHNLAKNFSDAAINLGISSNIRYSNEQSLVMACFVSLLTDQEAEVRAAAVAHLARMVTWGGSTHFTSHLQPLLPALADDIVMEVRSKCALALMDSADGGTLEDNLILQAFGPLLENFLQDEFHEVQLQVLTNLHKIAHLLPGLAGVVTSLLQMSKAANWRVREAVAKLLPHLAEARGLEFFATVLLEPVWMVLLLDPVASVRSAIVQGMGLLVKVAGDEWVMSQLLPQHVHLFNQDSSSYLVRMTIIQTHVEAAVVCKTGPLWNDFVVQILRGLNDKVANVRMVAAHGLARVVTEGDPAMVQSQIRPALEKRMQEDDDHDCRQACELALAQVK
jgi:serine/threonine-protein phosphatase 2A regulatory subunit A